MDLTIWQKWSLQKWKSELGEILKHSAFHKGTPNIHIHELSLTQNRWQSCCTKYSHLEVIDNESWPLKEKYTPGTLKFRFYDKGSRISFLCTVMLLTRLFISLNSHVWPWRQALTHVEQGDGDGPSNHVYQKSNAIFNKLSLIQNPIFNPQLGHHNIYVTLQS